MGQLFYTPRYTYLDDNGDFLVGGKVYFYKSGTSTPKDTYSDSTLSTPNTNPIILDSRGEALAYGSGSYKVKVYDSTDVLIYEEDDYSFSGNNDLWGGAVTATYVSATTFTVDDATDFHTGRRVKTSESAYGTITDVSGTTITVELSSGSLTASLASVQLGPAADSTSASVQYYPLKSGEVGVENHAFSIDNILRYIPMILHVGMKAGTNTTDLSGYIQNAVNSSREIYLPDNMSFFVAASIEIPVYTTFLGGGRNTVIVPSPTGSFDNGFVFKLNTTDGLTWDSSYPNGPVPTFGNLAINNNGGAATTRGVIFAGGWRIKDLLGAGLAQTIKSTTDYSDFVEIDNVRYTSPVGTDYQVDIQQLGDGLRIKLIFGDGGGADSNALRVNGCFGGEIKDCIGGSHYYRLCDAVNVSGFHSENGNITIDDSNITVQNFHIWARNNPRIVFASTDGQRTKCTIKDGSFVYTIDDAASAFSENDIKLHDNVSVEIENCGKRTRKSGNTAIGDVGGITIVDSANALISEFNNSSFVLSKNANIGYLGHLKYSHSVDTGSGLIYPIGSIQTSPLITWQKATDTYYYESVILYDATRQIGRNNSGGEESIAMTNGGGGILIPFSFSLRNPNTIIRLYRGTSTGSYDEFVDIHAVATRNLYDTGEHVNGYKWKTRAAAGVDSVYVCSGVDIKANSFSCYSSGAAAPVAGAWDQADIIYDTAPAAGGTLGLVCVASGTPGTWKAFGSISA